MMRLTKKNRSALKALTRPFKNDTDYTKCAATTCDCPNDHVHIRDTYKELGDRVPRRFLEVVAGVKQPAVEVGSGRLELAEHVVAKDNPLTARVIVNRVWHHLLGRGIVPTVDNLTPT